MAGRTSYVPGATSTSTLLSAFAPQSAPASRTWVDDESQGGDGFSYDPESGRLRMYRYGAQSTAAPQPAAPASTPAQAAPPQPAPQPQTPAPAPAPEPAPAPAPAMAPAPQAGPAVAALQSRAEPIDAGAGWQQVSTPGQTRPGLGQRLPFVPARSNGVRY